MDFIITQVRKTFETDVVIVGSGMAGLSVEVVSPAQSSQKVVRYADNKDIVVADNLGNMAKAFNIDLQT